MRLMLILLLAFQDKAPVPAANEIREAEKEIRSLYKADYADTTAAGRQRLNEKLLRTAGEKDVPAATRYALLNEALNRLAGAGDFGGALSVADRIAAEFDTPADKLRDEALQIARKSAKTPTQLSRFAADLLILSDELQAAENFVGAEKLARESAVIWKALKRAGMAELSQDLVTALGQMAQEKQADQGRYLCFVKGDWGQGLELLSQGTDRILKELAEKELAKGEPATLAEAWWGAARKATGLDRDRFEARAAELDRRAMAGATGLQKEKLAQTIEKRPRRVGKPIDLFAIVNPEADALEGKWAFLDENKLENPNVGGLSARLLVPISPPAEYDLEIEAAKQEGASGPTVGLYAAGRQFAVAFDSVNRTTLGLALLDGKGVSENESKREQKTFPDTKPHKILISVRSSGVTVKVDGQIVIDWKGSFERLSLHQAAALPCKNTLFLSAWAARMHFTKYQLTPVSGRPLVTRRKSA